MKLIDAIKYPTKVIFSLGMHGRFHFLDDETYLRLMYYCVFGKKLNLDNPQTFNEKLQWLKLHNRNSLYTKLVDKYEVKDYVAEIIGDQYIIPTLGVWDKFEDIDFDELPDQFVLKCTHDSGGLVICKDKSKLDLSAARRKIEKNLKKNYYWVGREWPYKNVKPRIIAEKYMADSPIFPIYDYKPCESVSRNETDINRSEIRDYKVFTFNGIPEMVLVCTDRFSEEGLKEDFFDCEWNHLKLSRVKHVNSQYTIPKPKNLDLMCQLSKTLSTGMPFVRVDFYEISGRVYFGEITLYPASGFDGFVPVAFDYELGKKLVV